MNALIFNLACLVVVLEMAARAPSVEDDASM